MSPPHFVLNDQLQKTAQEWLEKKGLEKKEKWIGIAFNRSAPVFEDQIALKDVPEEEGWPCRQAEYCGPVPIVIIQALPAAARLSWPSSVLGRL